MATQKARLHEKFIQAVEELRQAADSASKSTIDGEQRKWLPSEEFLQGWSGDPLDILSLTQKFDRSDIVENYQQCLADSTNPGTVGDTIALKFQADWLALQERATRLRHCSSVRAKFHAAARRRGHASDRGPLTGGTVNYVEKMIKRGSNE